MRVRRGRDCMVVELTNSYGIVPNTTEVRIPIRRGVLNTTLCDKVGQ